MSNNRCRLSFWAIGTGAWAVASALVIAPRASGGTSENAQSQMKKVLPREVVRTVESSYDVYKGEDSIGSEKVTRYDYNDNSVQFRSEVELELQPGLQTKLHTDLVLEEETYFPISFEIAKELKSKDIDATLETSLDWFSNVAVVKKTTPSKTDTSRVVLPTGVAVIDVNVAHLLLVPLYWYDTDAGGVQIFNVVDPWNIKTSQSTLRWQTRDTVEVNGTEVQADRYEFVRTPQTFKVYVDTKGRIVKLDQGFLVYELSDWSERLPGEE